MNAIIKDVCRIGQGAACCRYLLMGPGGFECAKVQQRGPVRSLPDAMAGRPATQDIIAILDARAAAGTIVARGDNCDGHIAADLNTDAPTSPASAPS